MNRCICDICGKWEADGHFKLKQQNWFRRRWVRLDICSFCYDELIDKIRNKEMKGDK